MPSCWTREDYREEYVLRRLLRRQETEKIAGRQDAENAIKKIDRTTTGARDCHSTSTYGKLPLCSTLRRDFETSVCAL